MRILRDRISKLPQPQMLTRYNCADHRPTCFLLVADYDIVDEWTFPEPVVITLRSGFHHDGGSCPKIVRSFVDNDDLKGAGPTAHDALYRYGGRLPDGWIKSASGTVYVYSRRQSDALFKRILDMDGVRERYENIAWLGVRLGGMSSWNSIEKRRKRQGGRVRWNR